MVITAKAIENLIYTQKISALTEKLNIHPKDISVYILAFIHRSIVNERPDFAPEHNERLEFLWDAVLELVITDALFKEFPEKPEWDLTDIRSALVRWTNLSIIAKKLNFATYLLLWKWEEKTGGRENDYILANSVESFIWAIYLDLWIDKAREFILEHIYVTLGNILEHNLTKDYKTLFQEHSQSFYEITPEYKLISDSGPDHDKTFEVWVYLDDKQFWSWKWSSKKKAQEKAAENAYLKLTKK